MSLTKTEIDDIRILFDCDVKSGLKKQDMALAVADYDDDENCSLSVDEFMYKAFRVGIDNAKAFIMAKDCVPYEALVRGALNVYGVIRCDDMVSLLKSAEPIISADKPEPVVVILDNLDMEHIKDEGGEPLKEGFMSRVLVYDGEINLNDYPTINSAPPGDSMTEMLEYRNGTLTQQKW